MIQFRTTYFRTPYRMAEPGIQCPDVTRLLSDYIDGELSDTDHQLVADHLAECANCQQIHQELLLTISLLNRLPKHVPRTSRTDPTQ